MDYGQGKDNLNSFNKNDLTFKKQNLNFSTGQKVTIISLLCVVIILLIVAIIPTNSISLKAKDRTVMIYIVGSNLETTNGIVTAELNAINPSQIDLKNTNILLYTGGTEKWHNFISNKDNGVYLLESSGFKKIDSQSQKNMGDSLTLSQFLRYGYENYKADKFELILYNHGGALDGAIYDDISADNLSLQDLENALKNSPFNKKNKFETVTFRTCLNGTIEVANVFKDYAKYLIGSEELSYGSGYSNVLGFLNNIKRNDVGLEYGIKFVDAYEQQMEMIDPDGTYWRTYSVIDLTKIDKLNSELDEYISSIDLTKNYNIISKIRGSMHQYGYDHKSFDMIDLYEFVVKTEGYATKDNDDLLSVLDEAIVYNKTNESKSHGISIYFPYAGSNLDKIKFLSIYENFNFLNEYKKFIKTFNSIQSTPSSFTIDLSKNKVELKDNYNEISIKLTDDQIKNYVGATFTIFERDAEHPNYYKPIFNTNNITLNNNGMLTANFKNQLVQIKDENGEYEYILTHIRDKYRTTVGILYDKDLDFDDDNYMSTVTLSISEDKNKKPIISNAKLISDNERVDGILLDLNKYEKLELVQHSYRILNEKNKVLDSSEWESAPIIMIYSEELKKIDLKYSSLERGDNYYATFMIKDIYGNWTTSKLIKVGE